MNARVSLPALRWPRVSAWSLAVDAFVVAVALLLVVYIQTVESLLGIWRDDGTYQYAFLIFPISVWIAFGLRRRVRAQAPVPSLCGWLALVLLTMLWFAGQALDVNLPQHFALVAFLPALVLALWGWRAWWVLRFPLVYLVLFAVPWGDAMVGPLQDVTARLAVGALQWSGMPVWLNGREIYTSSAVWMVEDACSGVKFFLACAALGSLYAYLMYSRTRKRVTFVLLSAVVPILANGLRVYFTIVIGETWGLHYASGTDHLIFGWQFFGTVLVVLFLLGWFFRDRPAAQPDLPKPDGGIPVLRTLIWPLAWAALLAGPVLATAMPAVVGPSRALTLAAPGVPGWTLSKSMDAAWRPRFHGASGQLRAVYQWQGAGQPVDLFHAVYAGRPRRGHTLVTYGNRIHDPSRTRVLASDVQILHRAGQSPLRVRELKLAGSQGARLVWYWYCVDGHCTSSPVMVKVLQAWHALRGGPLRSSVWALSTPLVHADAAGTRQILRRLARDLPRQTAAGRGAALRMAAGGKP